MQKWLSETDIRFEIDEALENKVWQFYGCDQKPLYKNAIIKVEQIVLYGKNRENLLMIVETKRTGRNLNIFSICF